MAHWTALAIVAVYIATLFAVTGWARRLTARGGGGMVAYLLAGRELPAPVAAALLAGLAIGGASTIGVAERAYTVGLSAGWYNAAWAAGALVMAGFAASRYRRLGITTLPELFERWYGPTARLLAVVGQLVIQVVITSLQYVAGGAILSSLLPGVFDLRTGMAVTAAVFVGITLIGGFWAAGLTNVINVILIYVGVVLGAVLLVGDLGGPAALVARLPAGHPGFDLWSLGPAIIAAWFLTMMTTSHGTQSVIQIGLAARSPRASARAYLIGGLIIAPVGFISAVIGVAAAAQHPGIVPTAALPQAVLGLSPLAAGVILAGLWAADVSTASALLLASATLVTNDLVGRRRLGAARGAGAAAAGAGAAGRAGDARGAIAVTAAAPAGTTAADPARNARREQLVCRLTVLGLSVLTFLLALTVTGILRALLTGLSLTSAYTLIVLMTLLRPGWCRRSSASWTLGTTMVALAAWILAPASWRLLPDPIYWTWLVGLVTFGVVAVADRRAIAVQPAEPRTAGVLSD